MTTAPVVSITDELLKELEEAAKAATPGPWTDGYESEQIVDVNAPKGDSRLEYQRWSALIQCYGSEEEPETGILVARSNAKHIVAANPATVLALIARVRELEKDAARYRWWRMFFETDSADMPDAVCGVRTPNELDAAIDAAMQNPTNGTTNPHQNG